MEYWGDAFFTFLRFEIAWVEFQPDLATNPSDILLLLVETYIEDYDFKVIHVGHSMPSDASPDMAHLRI